MKSLWSDREARDFCARYAAAGDDVALRVYTSRLIGADPGLVMHGGGNTSVKSEHVDVFGAPVPAIYVKGSGWDLDSIEPAGLPALDLGYLRRLRSIERLDDVEMVNQLRTHLFDASAPTPSVETLLHAYLPPKFIDHSHADAIVMLTNQVEGEILVREALGEEIAVVPYVMPGFDLARAAADVFDASPGCSCLVLMQHGLFTFGETARESYERHIELVDRAERLIAARRKVVTVDLGPAPGSPSDQAERERTLGEQVAAIGPLLRGALYQADEAKRRWLLDFRRTEEIALAVERPDWAELLGNGPLTPDHVIRTKELPLLLPAFDIADREAWGEHLRRRIADYGATYGEYFARNVAEKQRHGLRRLDSLPRVVIVEGLGVFAVGATRKAARIAADISEHTIAVKLAAPALGPYRALPSSDLFDVEYWSLEQAKLGGGAEAPLTGQVALVTGAAGAIGSAVVEQLAGEGAVVVATDIDAEPLHRLSSEIERRHGGGSCAAVVADVTDSAAVAGVAKAACRIYGGIDILVLNAGVARSAPIESLSDEDWQRIVDINLNGYFRVLRATIPVFKAQQSGGKVIINASKNVFAPGAEFAAYSASKAAGLQLGRVAAIELAPFGVRVNMVNPDAVFAHGERPSGLWRAVGEERARARGLEVDELEEYYRQRNLLRTRVTADDVARAVLFFARGETPTTGATLPVDGGIPAAFPR